MVNIIELRKHITSKIKTECNNVFYERATNDTVFPYVVYELDSINIVENKDNIQLDISIYDRSKDSINIEILTNKIQKIFDKISYCDNYHSLFSYVNVRNNVDTEKDNILRRRLLIDINYYGKDV